jgi:hypothetical protein
LASGFGSTFRPLGRQHWPERCGLWASIGTSAEMCGSIPVDGSTHSLRIRPTRAQNIAPTSRLTFCLDRPWKRSTLDAVPADLKKEVIELDIDCRAHMLMLFFASGDEFRAFIRSNPKRLSSAGFNDGMSDIISQRYGLICSSTKFFEGITAAVFLTA